MEGKNSIHHRDLLIAPIISPRPSKFVNQDEYPMLII